MSRRGWALWVLGGLAALLVAWLAAGIGLQASYAGKILPHTRTAGVDVGGLSPAAAVERLAAAGDSGRSVTLTHGGRRFTVSADEVGYRIALRASVQRAMAAGRRGPLGAVWPGIVPLWTSRAVAPADTVDEKRLGTVVAGIADRVDRPPFYGDLNVDTDPLEVRAVPPRPGYRVDRAATEAAVLAGLRRDSSDAVALPVRASAVTPDEVQAVARRAEAYLGAPLRLSGGKESVEISPPEFAPVLAARPVQDPDGLEVRLGVEEKRLDKLVASVAGEVGRDPVDAQIRAPARPTVIDNKGDLSWKPRPAQPRVSPGRSGRELDRSAAGETIARLVRDGEHRGTLPLRTVVPRLTTEAARRVTSLIGTFTTHFVCCPPRVTNIGLIAKAVDGTVIMPGEDFSLNQVAGPRTREKGYVPAPFISGDKLVPDVGGGTSQFSTTMYNAAYFAGLDIHGHTPHSFYISRYPVGREATLNYPTIDMTWTNDTDAPVLIRTATTDTSVTVTLYGDNGGRRVEAVSGPRKAWAPGDFHITVTRVITYPDGRVLRQPFTTRYENPPQD